MNMNIFLLKKPEFLRLVWVWKPRYCLYRSASGGTFVSQLRRVHTLTLYFLQIYFNIITFTSGSPN